MIMSPEEKSVFEQRRIWELKIVLTGEDRNVDDSGRSSVEEGERGTWTKWGAWVLGKADTLFRDLVAERTLVFGRITAELQVWSVVVRHGGKDTRSRRGRSCFRTLGRKGLIW